MDDQFGFVPDDANAPSDNFGFELAPEEQEKVTAYLKSQQPSEAESTLRGAEQGLAFGFADELGGAMGAGLEGFTNAAKQGRLPYDSELENLYAEYRDANRKRYKSAEEAHPNYFTAGAIGGGALVPAGAFGKMGQLASKATLGEKVAKGIGMGVTAGGLQGAGSSEAPVMSGEFARDVYQGGKTGGLVGGGLPITGAAAKGVYDIGKSIASPITKGFKQGIRGINLLGDDAERAIQTEIADYGKGLSSEIQDTLNTLGKQKTDLIREAQESGMQVDPTKIDEFINSRLGGDVKSNLPEVQRELEQFREMLRTAKQGPMVERDTRQFYGDGKTQIGKFEDLFVQKKMEQMLAPGSSTSVPMEVIYEPTDVANKTMGVIRQAMYDDMGNFAGYKKIASKLMDSDEAAKFKDITENVRAGGRDLSKPEELYQLYKDLKQKSSYGDYSFKSQEAQKATSGSVKDVQGLLRNSIDGLEATDAKIASLKRGASLLGMEDTVNVDKQQMMNKVIDLINRQEQVGATGAKARQQLAEFAIAIRAEHPGLAKSVESKIKDLGEQAIASKAVAGIVQPGVVSTIKRSAVAAGNVAGQAVYKMAKLPPEALVARAQQIGAKGGKAAQELSRIIGSLPDKNERERNAILFGLMQNPAYRQYLNSDDNGEEVK